MLREVTGRWGRVAVVALAIAAGAFMGAGLGGARVEAGASPAAVVAAAPAPAALATASYADLVARVAPSIVTVRSERVAKASAAGLPTDPEQFFRFFGERGPALPEAPQRQGGLGSGVVVPADGTHLTNHHVIDGAEKIQVELQDRRTFTAKLVGSDPASDLAVIRIDAKGLVALPLGDSGKTRVGDVVLAFGNPLGVGQTVTMGIVSAKGRATGLGDGSFEDFLQTDAPINQGNSGGALVNTSGELVGINSQILSPSGGNIGIGFAIPASMAGNVMTQLVDHGKVRRGQLGVIVQGVSSEIAKSLGLPEVRGALVSTVNDGSPAEAAGLKRGDVITAFNGETVADSNGLRNRVAGTAPGSTVTLRLLRGGEEKTVSVKLGELPGPKTAQNAGDEPAEGGRLGLAVKPLTAEQAREQGLAGRKGLVVVGVDPAGPASEAGFRPGDVIQEVNGKSVADVAELKAAVKASGDRPALVLVHRDGGTLFLALERQA
jgi:Do/DeqQ family serine protease